MTNMLSMLILMAAGVVVARTLGPELRGYFGLVVMAVSTLAAFGHLGLGAAISYYTGKKLYPKAEILSFLATSALLLGAALAVLFFAVYPYIPRIWTEIPRPVMLVGLIALPLTFFHNFLSRFLLGMLKVRQSNIAQLIRSLAYLLLVVLLLWILGGGLEHAVLSYSASLVIACALGYALFTRDIRPRAMPDPGMIRPFLAFGVQVYLIFLFNYLNHRFDIILIKHFLTPSDVSFYQIAVNASEQLWKIPNALTAILFPTLLAMSKGSARFTAKVCRNNFFLMFLLCILLLVCAKFLVVLVYGEAYEPTSYAIYSILWGILVLPAATVIQVFFASQRRLRLIIISSLSGFVFNLLANIYLIPRYGIVGAGIATSLSYSLTAIMLTVFFIRREQSSLRELYLIGREDFMSYREKIGQAWKQVRSRGKPGKDADDERENESRDT